MLHMVGTHSPSVSSGSGVFSLPEERENDHSIPTIFARTHLKKPITALLLNRRDKNTSNHVSMYVCTVEPVEGHLYTKTTCFK